MPVLLELVLSMGRMTRTLRVTFCLLLFQTPDLGTILAGSAISHSNSPSPFPTGQPPPASLLPLRSSQLRAGRCLGSPSSLSTDDMHSRGEWGGQKGTERRPGSEEGLREDGVAGGWQIMGKTGATHGSDGAALTLEI